MVELTEKHLNNMLKEMCKRVKTDFKTIDFKEPEWFYKYSWTEKEQDTFQDWLVKYLLRHKISPIKISAEKLAKWFILDYGWKLK